MIDPDNSKGGPTMAKKIQQIFRRVEKKYILTPDQYDALLDGMTPYMKADDYGRYTICNLYYDTEDFSLIRTSLEKPVYKEKLRLRSYGTPTDESKVFLEIKKKFDHVVYKRRAVLPCAQAMEYLDGKSRPAQEDQILREIDWFLKTYQPKPQVFIAYDRAALAGLDQEDLRVTFDTDLRWRDTDLDLRKGDQGELILPRDRILMEIKIPGTAPLWLSHLLSETGVFPTSFSKYGTCYRTHLHDRAVPAISQPAQIPSAPKSLKEALISA